jgi:hypothetical protein
MTIALVMSWTGKRRNDSMSRTACRCVHLALAGAFGSATPVTRAALIEDFRPSGVSVCGSGRGVPSSAHGDGHRARKTPNWHTMMATAAMSTAMAGRGSGSDETTPGWPAIGMVEAMLDGKTPRPFGINDLDFPNGRAVHLARRGVPRRRRRRSGPLRASGAAGSVGGKRFRSSHSGW